MTELLIRSLCELLPYKTICKDSETDFVGVLSQVDVGFGLVGIKGVNTTMAGYIPNCKPYLFPMSSMTEEEIKEYKHLVAFSGSPNGSANFINWLNAHHFDHRGLIPMRLALDATGLNIY